RSNPGVARSLGGLVLAAAILLTGCSSSEPADAGASPSSSTSTPSVAAPAEATPGIAGQDWVIVDFPYADGEETTVLDIEAGAGALWVVVGAPWKSIDGHKPASEIAVYRSTDAVEWEEVDILELGVP